MKLMIDTNIILDVLLKRDGLYEASAEIMRQCNKREHIGYITTNSICDLFYITRKSIHDKAALYDVMEKLCGIFALCEVTAHDTMLALSAHAKDFEDCLLAECAKRIGSEYIITRNGKDFKDFGINTISPEAFLQL